jgi:regulatory protein
LTDSAASARKYAFKLLGYRNRSEKELEERLQKKGFTADQISDAVRQLKKAGYLDDYALALDLKRQASDNKLFGHYRTKKFLLDRGVPDEIVDSALTYDEEAESEKIRKLIDKKLRIMGKYPDKNFRRKLFEYLIRKGYSFSTIKKSLREFSEIEEEE